MVVVLSAFLPLFGEERSPRVVDDDLPCPVRLAPDDIIGMTMVRDLGPVRRGAGHLPLRHEHGDLVSRDGFYGSSVLDEAEFLKFPFRSKLQSRRRRREVWRSVPDNEVHYRRGNRRRRKPEAGLMLPDHVETRGGTGGGGGPASPG